tara:strand:- start:58 stop:1740 length:1683 start_codon:yes stop_codon:yes gene_type:complete
MSTGGGLLESKERVRKGGSRKEAKVPRPVKRPSVLDEVLGVHRGGLGEGRVSLHQMHAISHLYSTHPAVAAARTVLLGQLLSGGLSVTRGGERVSLRPAFARHLEHSWMPFARDVVDSFLQFGLAVSIFEAERSNAQMGHAAKRAKLSTEEINGGGSEDNKAGTESGGGKGGAKKSRQIPLNTVPKVPDLGSYEVAFASSGRLGYSREFYVYNCSPGHGTEVDRDAHVHIRQAPDVNGNINSPIASVFDLATFVTSITEMAHVAEISRSTPSIVTQLRKEDKANQLDNGALFFDTESRNVASGQEAEESLAAARTLELQARLAKEINNVQQFARHPAGPSAVQAPIRSEVPPKLFTLPKGHELSPNVQLPQPRGDLGPLTELSIQQFSAALGVPASLIFEGKYAGKSTQQLQLLNSTVQQLATSVNEVLTACYTALYGDEDGYDSEPARLELRTSPLAANEEIIGLYGAGILPCEVAVPAALHALGVGPEEIDRAVEEVCKKRDKEEKVLDEDRKKAEEESKLNKREREVGMEATKASTEIAKKEALGMVRKSEASSSSS